MRLRHLTHSNTIAMTDRTFTVADIESMNYTDFIALLKETNRCPGGKKTIRRVRELIHIDEKTRILDVGSNTGFTTLELLRITPAHVSGIDISKSCVEEAGSALAAEGEGMKSRASFQVASAYDIPFKENEFDLLMAGGATSFMEDKGRAFREYLRVLKPWGFLVSTPLTYHTQPPSGILSEVGRVLGVEIKPMTHADWVSIVAETAGDFELYFEESHSLSSRSDQDIETYVEYFIDKHHIQRMPKDVQEAIREKWSKILKVFNENHKYLGYTITVFRKRLTVEEPELFISL